MVDDSPKVLSNEKKVRFSMHSDEDRGLPEGVHCVMEFCFSRTRQTFDCLDARDSSSSGRIRTATDDGNEAKFRLRGIEEGKGELTKNSLLDRSGSVRRYHYLLDDSNEISELRSRTGDAHPARGTGEKERQSQSEMLLARTTPP